MEMKRTELDLMDTKQTGSGANGKPASTHEVSHHCNREMNRTWKLTNDDGHNNNTKTSGKKLIGAHISAPGTTDRGTAKRLNRKLKQHRGNTPWHNAERTAAVRQGRGKDAKRPWHSISQPKPSVPGLGGLFRSRHGPGRLGSDSNRPQVIM